MGVGSSFVKKTLAQWRTISMTGCEGLPEEVKSGAEERLEVEDKVGGHRTTHAYLYICMHTYDYTIPTYVRMYIQYVRTYVL